MQYERLEDGDYDEYGEAKRPMPRTTKFVIVASLLATVGFAGAAWYSDSMPSLSELASSPSSEPIVSVFSNNDRIENVRPSANTESSEDCPDCASHTPPALTSSPELNKEDRIENVKPSANTESSEDCPDCASHIPPALTSSPELNKEDRIENVRPSANTESSEDCPDCASHTPPALTSSPELNKEDRIENVRPSANTESSEDCPDCASHTPPALTSSPELNKEDRIENVRPSANTESSADCPDCASHIPPALTSSPAAFFKLSSKKVTCDACDSLGDADCLSLLQSAFDSVDDPTEKLSLEKEILSHKYSCGSSLSDDSCLSYLDGKMGTLTNDEQLSLLTEACSAGNLPVDAPPAAEVTEEVPDGTGEAHAPEDTDEAKAPVGSDEAQAPEGSDEAQALEKRMQQH